MIANHMSPFLPCRQLSDIPRNDSRLSRFSIKTKPGKDVEKNAYIHFVDERDFKEVSVVGKRKSKKNRAVGLVLTAVIAESSSEDDEVEGDCSSEIGSSSAQPDENYRRR